MTNHTLTLPVHGMHCASCAATIQKKLRQVPGVENADVNFATEKVKLTLSSAKVPLNELNATISPYGYSLSSPANESIAPGDVPEHNNRHTHDHGAPSTALEVHQYAQQVRWALPLSLITFLIMIWEQLRMFFTFLPVLPIPMESINTLMLVVATLFMVAVGGRYLQAVRSFLVTRHANMDTLIGIGTTTAYIYSLFILLLPVFTAQWSWPSHLYFDVTIVVLGFITVGKYLEMRSKYQTGEALRELMALQAKTAWVKQGTEFVEVPIDTVQVDDTILIKPGSKVPIDAVVISGDSAVDESMVTGEPLPVDKKTGDKVIGGTMNTDGSLTCRVTQVGSATLLAQIVQMVEDAQGSKAPVEKLVDQISAVFVPAVIIIALLAFGIWLTVGALGAVPLDVALRLALTSFVGVLVIACPCALGLATPTAVVTGIGQAARHGILIKNAEALELLRRINTIVVDKTGTITAGKPRVTDMLVINKDVSESQLWQILAGLEADSEHPLAVAIINYAKQHQIKPATVTSFRIQRGQGVQGVIKSKNYAAGNATWMRAKGLELPTAVIEPYTLQGKTPIFIADETQILGLVFVSDVIKESAPASVKALHEMGLKIIMATGDDQQTAQRIAQEVGIDEVIAQALPADKQKLIKQQQDAGHMVAMVGDGINDAPALAQAQVGIAMSTGTDVAIAAAQVVILHGDISKIAQTILLSHRTVNIIRQNLFWAFIYNVIGIPLAAGWFYPLAGWLLNPAYAGLAMALSSVSVVFNSLRLRTRPIGKVKNATSKKGLA